MAFGDPPDQSVDDTIRRLSQSIKELREVIAQRTLPQGWLFRDNGGVLEVVNIDTGVATPLT